MNFEFLSQTALFQGCTPPEIEQMALLLDFQVRSYQKGEVILQEGSHTQEIGLVLSGQVQIEHVDFLGNKTILAAACEGDLFAEAYACLEMEPILIDVSASTESQILFISVPKILAFHPLCSKQTLLVQNLLKISARKNLQLSRRSIHTASKTIRERVLSYLSEQAQIQNSPMIEIPFDRQQMADYLNVERSALSKELGKMKKDGLIEYRKNQFQIKADFKSKTS